MKTYKTTIKTTIEKPRLEITYDEYTYSPRDWDNLGEFVTVTRNYKSPDESEEITNIINETAEEARNAENHFDLIKKELKKLGYKTIHPVSKYEHSGINYSLGIKNGFDSCFCGVYATKEKNTPKKTIEAEIETYNKYANGEVFSFILFDKNGEEIDSCGGFYDIESIKDYLPSEWKNENLNEYLNI